MTTDLITRANVRTTTTTIIRVRGACELRMVRAMLVEQRFVLCAITALKRSGIRRNMKARFSIDAT